jgi:hypothetical protein
MPQLGKSGSVGGLGGKPPRSTRLLSPLPEGEGTSTQRGT